MGIVVGIEGNWVCGTSALSRRGSGVTGFNSGDGDDVMIMVDGGDGN